MKNTKNSIEKKLIIYGNEYKKNYLEKWEINKMRDNSFEAFKFFIHHSFMRGRKDELSNKYSTFAIEELKPYFNNSKKLGKLVEICIKLKRIKKNSGRKNIINQDGFKKLNYDIINNLTKKEGLRNGNDLILLMDILMWVQKNENKNIFVYFENKVKSNKLKEANLELQNIYGIGDKIASFILRDIILLSNINLKDINDLKYAFPVDTWIAQVATKLLNKSFDVKKPNKLKNYVLKNFSKKNLPYMAAGLWYLGANSLEILVDLIKNNKVNEQ